MNYADKNQKYKQKDIKSKNSSKNNSLDYYMTRSLPEKTWWTRESKNIDHMKNEFLEKDIKTSEIIPENMRKTRNTPDNLGYFDTKFGTISVGYKKFNKKTDLIFSVIPEDVKQESLVKSYDLNDPKCYLNTEKKRNKKFKFSKLSFRYDPDTELITKFEKDNDGYYDTEQNLLYQDELEEDNIENLKNNNLWSTSKERHEISKQINLSKNIKEEKNRDNKEFVNNLKEFIKKFKKSELRKMIDSDEFISRSKRTKNINNNLDLVLIKKRRELLEDIFNIKLDNITQRKIEEIFEKLIIRVLEIIS